MNSEMLCYGHSAWGTRSPTLSHWVVRTLSKAPVAEGVFQYYLYTARIVPFMRFLRNFQQNFVKLFCCKDRHDLG